MRLRARLAAVVALALLLTPGTALADNHGDRCDQQPAAVQEDDCNGKREKPKFQTKFFSE